MLIVKHKDIDMTPDEIVDAILSHKIPHGTVIDITNGTITVSPEGKSNLFGLVGDDYEAICYVDEIE